MAASPQNGRSHAVAGSKTRPRQPRRQDAGFVSLTHKDHAIPLKLVVDNMIKRKSWTKASLRRFLAKWLVYVVLTRDEHFVRLKEFGLASSMPEDWDGSDILARYVAAKIKLVDVG